MHHNFDINKELFVIRRATGDLDCTVRWLIEVACWPNGLGKGLGLGLEPGNASLFIFTKCGENLLFVGWIASGCIKDVIRHVSVLRLG